MLHCALFTIASVAVTSKPPPGRGPASTVPPYMAARSVIPRALAEAKKTSSRRITLEHLLLAILDSEQPDPAAEVLQQLGIDRPATRERIRQASP